MNFKEISSKSVEELQKELVAVTRELFNLNIQKSMGQPPKSNVVKTLKHDIARLKTCLAQKGVKV